MIRKLIAMLIFIVLSPVFLVVALVIYFDDGFPIFFRQTRIGVNNSKFKIYKFRTMKNNTPDVPTHLVSDPKSFNTKNGAFLRKLSLDELPQLINIIKGDMVFVGPRPALYNQEDLISLRTTNGIHVLYPGITGWAQIKGRDDLTIEEKVQCDKYYLENKSFWLDAKIILLTFFKIVSMKSVSH